MVGGGAAAAHILSSSPKTNESYYTPRHLRQHTLLAASGSLQLLNGTISNTTSYSRAAFTPSMLLKKQRFRSKSSSSGVLISAAAAASSSSSSSDAVADNKKSSSSSSAVSDIVWPSIGAFGAMALLGKIDQLVLASRGMSLSIAPLGAVCAVLFLTPSAPAAKKYNMFMAQIGCAAIGVFIYSLMGPGWPARSVSLSLSIAFMALTRCNHPPAAGLPLLYIDGAKFHHLNYWFAIFPAAFACIILAIIQEIVCFLKENVKF